MFLTSAKPFACLQAHRNADGKVNTSSDRVNICHEMSVHEKYTLFISIIKGIDSSVHERSCGQCLCLFFFPFSLRIFQFSFIFRSPFRILWVVFLQNFEKERKKSKNRKKCLHVAGRRSPRQEERSRRTTKFRVSKTHTSWKTLPIPLLIKSRHPTGRSCGKRWSPWLSKDGQRCVTRTP